jgi:hypothetical protein
MVAIVRAGAAMGIWDTVWSGVARPPRDGLITWSHTNNTEFKLDLLAAQQSGTVDHEPDPKKTFASQINFHLLVYYVELLRFAVQWSPVQGGFVYARENKCDQMFAKRRILEFAKYAEGAHEKYQIYCWNYARIS